MTEKDIFKLKEDIYDALETFSVAKLEELTYLIAKTAKTKCNSTFTVFKKERLIYELSKNLDELTSGLSAAKMALDQFYDTLLACHQKLLSTKQYLKDNKIITEE